jgi:PilZ domain
MQDPIPLFMEHRWGQRLPCRATVTLSAGDGQVGVGRMRDVSSSGAYIETDVELPVNTAVTLRVTGNESSEGIVQVEGSVVRVERGGMGVEWFDTPTVSICQKLGCTSRCVALTTSRS